jgi:hypothetical protein
MVVECGFLPHTARKRGRKALRIAPKNGHYCACGGLFSAECLADRLKMLCCEIGKKENQQSAVSAKEGAVFRIFLVFLFALKLNALDDAEDEAKSEHGKKDVVSHNL